MLKQRIATAVILLLAVIASMFFLSNFYWSLLLLIFVGLGGHEWSKLAHFSLLENLLFFCLIVLSVLLFLYWDVPERCGKYCSAALWVYLLALGFWLCICPFWLKFGWKVKTGIPLIIVGWLLLVPTWLALGHLQTNPVFLITTLGIIWIADSAAYLVGRKWGRRKLAPNISPGKTWEGFLGAFFAVTAYGLLIYFETQGFQAMTKLFLWLGITYVIFVLSFEGDLFESLIKRLAGVKDSGKTLPGHGGILDRVDSLTSTTPFIALLQLLGISAFL